MEKMVFVVRKAVEGDIPEIQQITREAFRMYMENAGLTGSISALEETYEDIKKDIESKEVLVALIDGVVVGSVRVEVRPDRTAYLSRFGVGLANQNHGVGKILMNAVDDNMKKQGVTKIYLHTASKILSLVRFYYGRGFYIDSTTKDRGYIRALLCKEYEYEIKDINCPVPQYETCAV
jgi:N-acetylglutamate synthase-like GNAT family acetyltransferase